MPTISITPSELLPLISKVSPFIKKDLAFPNSEHFTLEATTEGCAIYAGTSEAKVSYKTNDIRANENFVCSLPAKKVSSLFNSHAPSSMFTLHSAGDVDFVRIVNPTSKYKVRAAGLNEAPTAPSGEAVFTAESNDIAKMLKQACLVAPYAKSSAAFQTCVFLLNNDGKLRVMAASSAMMVKIDTDIDTNADFCLSIPHKEAQTLADQLGQIEGKSHFYKHGETVSVLGDNFAIEMRNHVIAPFDPNQIRLSPDMTKITLDAENLTSALSVANSLVAEELNKAVKLLFSDKESCIQMPSATNHHGSVEIRPVEPPENDCETIVNPRILLSAFQFNKDDVVTMDIPPGKEMPILVSNSWFSVIISPVRLANVSN